MNSNDVSVSDAQAQTATALHVFISHSARDENLAGSLVNLLRTALNLPASTIRCTSVSGYKLPAGAKMDDQLRRETIDARVLIGLLTGVSIRSAYVLFELGARWGAKRPLMPLLGGGVGSEILAGPLSELNALKCSRDDLHQLVDEVGDWLETAPESANVYGSHIDAVIEASDKIAHERASQQASASDTTAFMDYLDGLDPNELFYLAKAVSQGEQTLRFGRNQYEAPSLAQKGLLEKVDFEPDMRNLERPYTIPTPVWKYLTEIKASLLERAIAKNQHLPGRLELLGAAT